MKRIVLFAATNLAILAVLVLVASLLGLGGTLDARGVALDLPKLLAFAAVFGMGGSFLSLLLSKWLAKRATGARVIERPADEEEAWLVQTVRAQALAAGIGVPEVAVYDSPEPNAFATGARRDAALVAVSTGLLRTMSRREVESVLAHEVSHVQSGDMVTLALIQGVVNTFVLFLSRVIGHAVDRLVFRSEEGHGPAFLVTSLASQLVLGIFATLLVLWFSRQREFRADAGAARLAGREGMIAALESLRRHAGGRSDLPEGLSAFGIAGGGGRFARWFASHPPLEQRIERLRNAA
ncbi:MAG: protease HtpX [Deltaproteobacteria bacterium]|nr:protease HtpX [Deltaproteobacteria bacterium]